jgi:hypothetical protein
MTPITVRVIYGILGMAKLLRLPTLSILMRLMGLVNYVWISLLPIIERPLPALALSAIR